MADLFEEGIIGTRKLERGTQFNVADVIKGYKDSAADLIISSLRRAANFQLKSPLHTRLHSWFWCQSCSGRVLPRVKVCFRLEQGQDKEISKGPAI